MKPRRWYSSPELDPSPTAPARPFPTVVYWRFTTHTQPQQGQTIKATPPEAASAPDRRGVRIVDAPRLRRINAA